jgi:uncharacterized protein
VRICAEGEYVEGEYDGVKQAFLLQQRLTELNHPDHLLITYPNLGHGLYLSNQGQATQPLPIPQYVLADLYSGFTNHAAVAAHMPTTSSVKP